MLLLGHCHSALQIVLPAILPLSFSSILSCHFSTVMLRCCCHTVCHCHGPDHCHGACHCRVALPLSYNFASSAARQSHTTLSLSHCLPLFEYFAAFVYGTLMISYTHCSFASVMWLCHCHAGLPRMLLSHCHIALPVILLCLCHVAFFMLIATVMLCYHFLPYLYCLAGCILPGHYHILSKNSSF